MAGTSTAKAQMILARGFKPSPGGCLGPGVYVCVPRTEPEAVPPSRPSRSYPPFFACLALAARMTRRRGSLHATLIGMEAMWGRG